MKYVVDKNLRPAYLQVYKLLKEDIVQGVFPYNSRLPSKRLLANELKVSTVTIEHAYALLCDEGYTEARERSGYFVIFRQADGFAATAQTAPALLRTPHEIPAYPAFSVANLSKIMRKVLTDYHEVLLDKSPNAGCETLREAIRAYLARNRGIHVAREQIIIGSGAEYLYGLIIKLLGRDKIYAIETPAYDKLEQIYRAADVACELLPLSADGIDSNALAHSQADVLHTTPYRSYPTGITATASKRHEYIRWANAGRRFIIE